MAKKSGITDWKFVITLLSLLLVGLSVFALNQRMIYKSSAAPEDPCKREELSCKFACKKAGGTQNRRCLETDINGNCLADEPITQTECESECKREAFECALKNLQQQGSGQETQQKSNNSQKSGSSR